jgi:hypothetical protein
MTNSWSPWIPDQVQDDKFMEPMDAGSSAG